MKELINIILAFTITYILAVFVSLNFNIFEWEEQSRMAYLGFSTICYLLIRLVILTYER